jgi:hypothetical protein
VADAARADPLDGTVSMLFLREIRGYLRRSHAVMMAVFFALVYALVSMTEGGMLVLAPLGGGYTFTPIWANALGVQPWSYPGLLIVAPWGIVTLPLWGTFSMIVVSAGVGMGMAVAVLLAVSLVRRRSESNGGPAALGALTGLTPAMIALLALGACCSTTAAAAAGVGLIAQVSGSTAGNLYLNSWYLGVFQIAIVGVALIAQEALLRAYGGLFGRPGARSEAAPRVDRRVVAGTAVRAALLIAGLLDALLVVVGWTTVSPFSAPAGAWFEWAVVRLVPGTVAILVALFPAGAIAVFWASARTVPVRVLRAAVLTAGLLLAVGAPPPLPVFGVEGIGNEILGSAGLSAAWGGFPPVFAPGLTLAFRWTVEYLVPGGFAIALALRPSFALRPALWSRGESRTPAGPRPDPAEAPVAAGG